MIKMLFRSLDWDKYLNRMLPIALRGKAVFGGLLNIVSNTFKGYNDALVTLRTNTLFTYKGSGQVIVLERILRERFNNGASGISIINRTEFMDEYYLYRRREPAEPLFGYKRTELPGVSDLPVWLYLRNQYTTDDVPDFVVKIDTAIQTAWIGAGVLAEKERGIKTLVNLFKIYGSTYTLIYV